MTAPSVLYDMTYEKSAEFSECGAYRYLLLRRWAEGSLLHFICLNPSTATDVLDDPTVTRLTRRARMWKYGGLIVSNLFAVRTTNPGTMLLWPDPIGPENDEKILDAVQMSAMTICGWGAHGKHLGRSSAVRKLLAGRPLRYLRLNKDGEPAHPLYLPYHLKPKLLKATNKTRTT